jgi:hypothetical protein
MCKEIIVQQGKRYKWVFEDDFLDMPDNDGIISTNVLFPRRIATCDHRARVWRSLGSALFSARGGDQADREGMTADERSVETPR